MMLDTYTHIDIDDTQRLARLKFLQAGMQELWDLAEADDGLAPWHWARFEALEVQERALLRPGRMLP